MRNSQMRREVVAQALDYGVIPFKHAGGSKSLPLRLTLQVMRADKLARHQRLCELIEQTIAEAIEQGEDCEFEGYCWAIRPQSVWAELLGVSVDAITDLIKEPPIRRSYTQVEGKKAVLLRVGDAAPLTERELANIMKARFRKATGRDPSAEGWAMLRGLASSWPEGAQIDIFQTVLDDWPAFKARVAMKINDMIENGEPAHHAWHKYPSISVILRFHALAVELYIMKLKEKGKKPPPSIVALAPSLWLHLNGA